MSTRDPFGCVLHDQGARQATPSQYRQDVARGVPSNMPTLRPRRSKVLILARAGFRAAMVWFVRSGGGAPILVVRVREREVSCYLFDRTNLHAMSNKIAQRCGPLAPPSLPARHDPRPDGRTTPRGRCSRPGAVAHGHRPFGAVLVGPDDAILIRRGNIDTVRHAGPNLRGARRPPTRRNCTLVQSASPR